MKPELKKDYHSSSNLEGLDVYLLILQQHLNLKLQVRYSSDEHFISQKHTLPGFAVKLSAIWRNVSAVYLLDMFPLV